MMRRVLAIAGICVAALMAFPAGASAYMFGEEETLVKLVDIDATRDGHTLYLGHKITAVFFLLGVTVHDDGYVLGMSDAPDRYFDTSPEELAEFQAKGLVPVPLPAHGLSVMDLLVGYSLWIALAIFALMTGIGWLRRRGAPAGTPTATPGV